MLEPHSPHSTVHTWKDAFIHIGIIAVGLLIAIGLEQTVEFFHHRHQRHQLEEDLRDEAQRNIGRIEANQKNFAVYIAWYRDVLKIARAATPSSGLVTFVIPARVNPPPALRPLDSVWPAAKASGTVAVLSREEVEIFGRVDSYAEQAEKDAEVRDSGRLAEDAVLSRLGLTDAPGATLRMTPAERDELMRVVALHLEGVRQLSIADAIWEGSSDAALHGARPPDEMAPYIARATAALPK
jgi:hypothetical protein